MFILKSHIFHFLFMLTFIVCFLTIPVSRASAAGWVEDWQANKQPALNYSTPPSNQWSFHTYNLYADPAHPNNTPASDSYSVLNNVLTMKGNSWGLESKQHFHQGAPISVESWVKVDATNVDTSQAVRSLAGITIYDGETGVYEEISLEDYAPDTDLGHGEMRVWRRTEGTSYAINSTNLNHGDWHKLRLEFDGAGTWRYYLNDSLLHTVNGRFQSSAPNIFILGVTFDVDSNGNIYQPIGNPSYQITAEFKSISVEATFNLFSQTSWIDFFHDSYRNYSINSNANIDTNDGYVNYGISPPKANCPWYDPNPASIYKWPQCDFIELAHSPPDDYDSPNFVASGTVTTPEIELAKLSSEPAINWGEIVFNYALAGPGSDLYIRVLGPDGSHIPETDLPGNSSFRRSPVILSELDKVKYPRIKLEATLSSNSSQTLSPKLFDWTLTPGTKSYFSWYDMQSTGMKDWLLMSNASGASSHFLTQLGAPGSGRTTFNAANPNSSATQTFPGIMDGPLMVNALSGLPQVISQRVLFGNSLEETIAIPENELSNDYYWTWYDMQTPGYKDWIVIANPDYSREVNYEIRMPGVDPATTPGASGTIPPGGRVTPMFPGVMGGPVEVKSSGGNVIASQRVLMFGDSAFNEVNGTPVNKLTNHYLWTWYDQQSTGSRNWVLVANPNPTPVEYQISVAGGCSSVPIDSARCKNGVLYAAGDPQGRDQAIPTFPGVMGGPVEVTSTGGNIIASQRILWDQSFEEVPGYSKDLLSDKYNWTWYDQQSAGSRNWVLVANFDPASIYYEIKIGGTLRKNGTLGPGQRAIPSFSGVMGGPVQVQAWTDSGKTVAANIFASQRLLWSGHLNEVLGTDLSP